MLAKEKEFNYTPEQYLALEEQAIDKNEYRQGQIFAMESATLNHNRIAGNICFAMRRRLAGKGCETFIGDVRLSIDRKKMYTYPDVMVVCGEPKFVEERNDTIVNPKVVLEVLSKSTAAYDRSDKFQAYWSLESFEEYVLIDQYRVHVEYFRRQSGKMWELNVFTNIEDVLSLKSIEAEIPLREIYQNVVWDG